MGVSRRRTEPTQPRVAPHELNGPRRCGAGAAPLDGKGKIGGPPPWHRPAPSALEVVLL